MTLSLHNVLPEPITLSESSEVWQSDLLFEPGQSTMVMAASGKGKSTLLHILYGLRQDYSGQAMVASKSCNQYTAEQWAELRQNQLSIVFQDLRLFSQMTAWENIQLKNNLTNHKTDTQLRDMAERLGIAPFLSKLCGILSYGQRQRVAIVRALCQPFKYLLLDEPFSHLDKDNIALASALIKEECAQNQSGIIMVSLGDDYSWGMDRSVKL